MSVVAAYPDSPYGAINPVIKTPRDIEYSIIARVTGALQAQLPHAVGTVSPGLAKALHDNQRLWVAFATDLAHPDNAFPDTLRARLFYLAEFTVKHTAAVLAGRADAAILSEINTSIMRGLRNIEVPQ